ncbi:MAG: helicase-related protein, partial [Vicinamibacterales bacterium]
STARKILGAEAAGAREDDDEDVRLIERAASEISTRERGFLEAMVAKLESIDLQGGDPKFRAVRHYLVDEGWHGLGCIVFSQYYDTADWIAGRLARELPSWRIALYAGAGRSRIMEGGRSMAVDRDVIKAEVRKGAIRLVVATDAACEGLNLQRLGALINVDLPWNPSRLEQRIGRIKRFGQTRSEVDVLNLVYRESWDERVLGRLSMRLKDRYDLFGGLPDVIDDEWIEDIEDYERYLDSLIDGQPEANAFELRYAATMEPDGDDWALCADVLSRIEVDKALARPW